MSTTRSSPSSVSQSVPVPHANRWYILAAVCFGLFLTLLDITIVNVALPSMAKSLRTDFAGLQWIGAAYALSYAVFVLVAARLGDVFGRKTIFLSGLSVFSFASLLCGLSPGVGSLIAARALQGFGAAMITPVGASLISEAFWGPELPTAFGLYGAISGLAMVAGPVLGGVMVPTLGWPSIFLINIPIGVLGVALSARVLPAPARLQKRSLDLPGQFFSACALLCLVLGLIQGGKWGWADLRTVSVLVLAVVCFVVFVVWEQREKAAGRDAMMDLALFRLPAFSSISCVTLIVSMIYSGFLFLLAQVLQNGLGFSPAQSGQKLLPFVLCSVLVSPLSGLFSRRFGPGRVLAVGLAILTYGLVLIGRLSPSTTGLPLDFALLVSGIGGALVNLLMTAIGAASAPQEHTGIANGVIVVMRRVGDNLGIALLGAFLTLFAAKHGGVGTISGWVGGFNGAMHIAAGLSALALLLTLLFIPLGKTVTSSP